MHTKDPSDQQPNLQKPHPTSTGPYTSSPANTEDLLISQTTLVVHKLNIRDFNPESYTPLLSPHLRIDCNSNVETGIPQAIQAYKWVSDINPLFHVGITEATPIVYEESGRATIMCVLHLKHCSDDTIRAGTLSTSWKREKGKGWICWNFEIFFGIREFF
ncbi:hypothetical protein PRZ48_005370 [Zasmidium cellare]|uniref:Uncharacterized protein n=1 Tax=Zasmidium cellare TaxID=395010 RepID=A0ABR0ES58_ZASCE|nr:hypothetical protein PRZ48_005370 [Zasmidium cellare]